MLAVLLVLAAAPQDPPAPVGPIPTAAQVALVDGGLHGHLVPVRGAPADPEQWVEAATNGALAGLVVRTAGDEPWLEALVEAAAAAELPLGWAYTGDLDALVRLLELTPPFLVEVEAEGWSTRVDLVSARAPDAPNDAWLQRAAWLTRHLVNDLQERPVFHEVDRQA